MVVLDTDHLSLLQRADSVAGESLRRRLAGIPPPERAATIVSFEEQSRGWLKYLARARTAAAFVDGFRRLHKHLQDYCVMTVLGFDERAGSVFETLQKQDLRIGTKDMQIAAIALANDSPLLTRNLRHFVRVPGLRIEDWTV